MEHFFYKHTVYLGWKQNVLCCTHFLCIAWRTPAEKPVTSVILLFAIAANTTASYIQHVVKLISVCGSGPLNVLGCLEYNSE